MCEKMSGIVTVKLDELFTALTENAPITNKLIKEAQTEYNRLRSSAVRREEQERQVKTSTHHHDDNVHEPDSPDKAREDNSQHRQSNSRSSHGHITDGLDTCPHCKKSLGPERREAVTAAQSEIARLQKELFLKASMCKDLHEQIHLLKQNRMSRAAHGQSDKQSDISKRVAERYNELFENEWMWVYGYMDNQLNLREDKILEVLLRILRAAYKFCEDIAKSQITNIEGEILCPLSTWTESKRIAVIKNKAEIPNSTINIAKQYRQSTAQECVPSLQEAFIAHILPEFVDRDHINEDTVITYVKQCVHMCWIFQTQDPPMYLVTKIIRKNSFNTQYFRHYTRDGDKYDFVVWPALLLYANGPVIMKGIAQSLDTNRSKYESRSKSPQEVTPRKSSSTSPNAALRGTPWGSQQFSNRGTPSVDLPPLPDEEGREERIENPPPQKIHSRTISVPSLRKEKDNRSVGKQGDSRAQRDTSQPIVSQNPDTSGLTSAWQDRHSKMQPVKK